MATRNVSVLVLYNAEGKILLQHRDKNAARLPDYWGFFGGGIEGTETPEEALKREIEEELSYTVQSPHFLTEQKFTYKEDENTAYVFVEKYGNQQLTQSEGQGMGWFFPAETTTLKMVDHDRFVIEKVENYLKQGLQKQASPISL